MSNIVRKLYKTFKKTNWAIAALNAMALVTVIQNVNTTCTFLDYQPEVPDEACRFKKISQRN